MGRPFDDLSKAMARRVSRGQALRGVLGAAGAAALAVIMPRKTSAGSRGGNSACAHFCHFVYGANTPEAESCTAQAAHGTGPCYSYGPGSPYCQGVTCPPGQFCTSLSMNYGVGNINCQPY